MKPLLQFIAGGALFALAASCGAQESISTDSTETSPAATEASTNMTFAPRPETPRIDVVDPTNLTSAQTEMLASRPDYNIYKTLAHHPELYARWSPLGRALLNNENIESRHREIAMLRMGWLCQAEYEWAQHARIAHENVGMSEAEIHRIAEGASADGWSATDRAVIHMADELRYEAMISDATWSALRETYDDQQIIDLMFTAAQYQLVSMALNSLGVQLDPELEFTLPDDLPLPALANIPQQARLTTPRLAPLSVENLTDEQRAIVQPRIRDDGTLLNIYGTLIHHPVLFGPRLSFGSYIQADSNLPARTRELLILRTASLIKADYEIAHHIQPALDAGLTAEAISEIATGSSSDTWNAHDRAILRAAEDLRHQAFITDAVWAELSQTYTPQQMVEIVFTVGGYTMTGLALNSLGVQIEDGYPTSLQ